MSLDAQQFRPFWKLPNLYLPCGSALSPPLRRDAVRKLLADDPAQVTWLYPQEAGRFTPESLPEEAFRALEDWIDYVIDHEHEPLQAWVQATHFDFDSFICTEDQPERPKPAPGEKGKRPRKRDEPRDYERLARGLCCPALLMHQPQPGRLALLTTVLAGGRLL